MTGNLFDTMPYRLAPSGYGDQALEWMDKPTRLVYDLCDEIERLQSLLLAQGQYNALIPSEEDRPISWDSIKERIAEINMKFHEVQKLDQSQRPYPDGIAWDEAWRQRLRADALEELLRSQK